MSTTGNNNDEDRVEADKRYPRLYDILGVTPSASSSLIRDQFKKLSLERHPDRGGQHQDMVDLVEAYEILSNTNKRYVYDVTGMTDNIQEISDAYNTVKNITKYFPIYARVWIESKLNIKDLVIYFALKSKGEIKTKLGFSHVGGFRFVHQFLDDKISSLLGRFTKNREFINLFSEVLSTTFSAPFEISAFRAYQNGFSISHWKNYFIFNSMDLNIFQLAKYSLLSYYTFLRRSPYHILGLVGFRIGFTFLHYTIASFADYADRKYLDSINLQQQHKPKQSNNDEEQEQEQEEEEEEVPIEGDKKWLLLSRVINVSSFIIPSMLFSVYRLFDCIESGSMRYFSGALVKSGLIDGISVYLLDNIITRLQKLISIAEISVKDIIYKIQSLSKELQQQNDQQKSSKQK